ncbi:hypothetical protein DRP04_04720 [Archaeoglobales archaeon]|nr:MAG: hypothetical protein DRP04_04720 [Archaeoglobales archaeon]
MWEEYLYKFFEYMPLYLGLVLVPALIRTVIDTAIIKIKPSTFELPPSSKESILSIKYEDAFSSFVGTSLYAPLVEELVFRGCPYLFFGLTGLVVGNIVWVLAHPSWQLRYISGLPLEKKLAFTANTVFYYSCASIFFSIPWLQDYGLLAITYHMAHNAILTLGGFFHEIELPAPWKKEEAEFFRESRGLKRKLEEKYFRDTKPSEIEEEEEELEVDFEREFFKSITPSEEKPVKVKREQTVIARAVDDEEWLFWRSH